MAPVGGGPGYAMQGGQVQGGGPMQGGGPVADGQVVPDSYREGPDTIVGDSAPQYSPTPAASGSRPNRLRTPQ